MPRRRLAQTPASHAWIFDLLFATESAVTWAAAGELPAGYQPAERFAVLPAIAGRSFVVSLATRAAASSALTSYNALRTAPRRMVRDAFSLGLRTGLAQPFIGRQIDVGQLIGADGQAAGGLFTEHLRQQLGSGPVALAFGGGAGPYRKPVLQVFSRTGTPLAYVKVGWNDWTREAVRREAAALRTCAAHPMGLGVPELIGHSQWQGLDLLITAPLPSRVRRLGLTAPVPDVAVLREISQLSPVYASELAASTWWQGLRARIGSAVADTRARDELELVAGAIERHYGQTKLEFGSWHGDFVPWNLARLGSRVYAWDWESSGPDAPLGFDALHYYFQVAFVARRRALADAAVRASHRAAPALAGLGLTADLHGLVAALHLIELFVRHEEARSSAGGVDERFYPAVAELLARSLAAPLGIVARRAAADRAA